MIKLLGSSKSKISKDVNGENMPHLEITGVELVPSSIFNKTMSINRIRESYVHLLPVNFWSITRYFTQKFLFY